MAILVPRTAALRLRLRARWARQIQRFLHQIGHAVAVGGGDHVRIAHAQFVEVGHHRGVLHAFGLVDHQHHRTTALAQEVGDGLVVRRQALAAVDDEDHDVGFGHGLLGLLGHLVHDAVLGHGFEATGVDHEERTFADTALAVVTIARQAGQVRHQRIALRVSD
jgi:hypothetical protein